MIQKKYIYIYMLHEDLRKFRLPIITIEGYKDRAALLKLLINYYVEGQVPHTRTHYIKHKKKKRKKASRKRKKQKKPKYASRNGGIRVANMRSLFCHASRIDREDSDAEEKP